MSATSRQERSETKSLSRPTAPEIIKMYVDRNPSSRARAEAVDTIVAKVSARAVQLPLARQQVLSARKGNLSTLVDKIFAQLIALQDLPKVAAKAKSKAGQSAEIGQGKGVGALLSVAEGRSRLAAYATPLKIEDWAGLLAKPTELEREGIARSTLNAWKKKGAVIGLLTGTRKHAYPVEQFVDGRPVEGLARVLDVINDPRTAWLWLREPNPGLAGAAPLSRLKSGDVDGVIEAVRSNFGRE